MGNNTDLKMASDSIKTPVDPSDDICQLINDGADDSESLVCIYLTPNPQISNIAKSTIADSDDFYSKEALANWLKVNGNVNDESIAEKLASAPHPQVSNPGKRALGIIR